MIWWDISGDSDDDDDDNDDDDNDNDMYIYIYIYIIKYQYYIYNYIYIYIDEWCVYMPQKKHDLLSFWASMVSTEADGLAETNHKSSGIIR